MIYMLLLARLLLLPLGTTNAFPLTKLDGVASRTAYFARQSLPSKAKLPGVSFSLVDVASKENPWCRRKSFALATNHDDEESILPTAPSNTNFAGTVGLVAWLLAISFFIVINVKVGSYPESVLLALNRQQWSLVHAISNMMFGGTILLSTLIEHLVVSSQNVSVVRFWFLSIPGLDSLVVLPALTGGIVSGIAQATIDYGGMLNAPKYITGAVHSLLTFGIWWAVTDVTTQKIAKEMVRSLDEDDKTLSNDNLMNLLHLRRISNIVSCLMVAGLYALMVMKPTFGL